MKPSRYLVRNAISCGWAAILLASPGLARGQGANPLEISDTLFAAQPRAPISYFTTYDRNLSRGTWTQSLSYYQNTNRVSFGVDANMMTIEALRGLRSDGRDGDVMGRIGVRATNRWFWSLDGRFNMASNDDDFSATDRRQNNLQVRTQYTFDPWRNLRAVGILSTEFQQDQSLGERNIPSQGVHVRDSSFTSGRRDGLSATVTWAPWRALELKSFGSASRIRQTTRSVRRESPASGPDSTTERSNPNGDERYEASARYTGLARTVASLVLKNSEADQQYFLLTRGKQEHLSNTARTVSLHLEHAPFAGVAVSLDGTIARSAKEYLEQVNFNSLVHTRTLEVVALIARPETRANVRLDLGRIRNERQITQNGTVIARGLSLGGAQRLTNRLWVDGIGTVSLYSRLYEDRISDKDDVRGYANVGGGYRVSARCSTSVHFSTNRSHAVAIHPSASGGNNVQTTYQMDAALYLRVSPAFMILQNYQINANYLIYDYDEPRNTLARIRRINTEIVDSLFGFAFVRLTHNFFFQDRGSFTRAAPDDHRKYAVAHRLYQQNLGATLGVSPLRGIVLMATQSLANTRNYFPTPASRTNRNRWNLNLAANVNRELPGAMTLNGSVQRISEYTEGAGGPPATEMLDYWIAGVTLMKDF